MKIDAKDPQTWISRDLFQSYCGAGSEKLLRFYDKAVEKKNLMPLSLNWLALLVLPAWLGYRRQWKLFVTVAVLCAAVPFIEGILDIKIPSTGLTAGILALGAMANGLLLMSANGHFTKLKKKGGDTGQIKEALENRAASSIPWAIGGTIMFFTIQIASVLIAGSFWELPA